MSRVETVKLAIWLAKLKGEAWPARDLLASDFPLTQDDRRELAELISVRRGRGRPRGAKSKHAKKNEEAKRTVKQVKRRMRESGQTIYGKHKSIVADVAKSAGIDEQTLENSVRRGRRKPRPF